MARKGGFGRRLAVCPSTGDEDRQQPRRLGGRRVEKPQEAGGMAH